MKYAIVAALLLGSAFTSIHAAPISGQGTWETTLQGRDLDGNAATFEAYYDTTLDITWLADANAGAGSAFDDGSSTTDGRMTWANANAWAAALDVNGVTGWRLPTVAPINGSAFQTNSTTNATSDVGYATSAGWLDDTGVPVSEMGDMYYVTLGNLGACPPDGGDGDPSTCDNPLATGWGLTNTAAFLNVQSNSYWSGTELSASDAWGFSFFNGIQGNGGKSNNLFAWAVRSGDVSAAGVPVPGVLGLFGIGLVGVGMLGAARRRR